jgi:predicted transposase YdaD
MRLAPLYQQDREQAVQEGRVQGIEQGRAEGIEQGRQREANLILRLLERRFGEIPQNLTDIIRELPIEKLENLGGTLLDLESLSDLAGWLER